MDSISSPIKIIRGKEIQLVIIFDGDFRNLANIKSQPEMLARYMRDPDLKFADERQYPVKKMQKSIDQFKYYQNKGEFNDNAKEIEEAKTNPDYKAEEVIKLVPDLKFYSRLRNMRPYVFDPTLNKTEKFTNQQKVQEPNKTALQKFKEKSSSLFNKIFRLNQNNSQTITSNINQPPLIQGLTPAQLEFNKKLEEIQNFSYDKFKSLTLSIFSKVLYNIVEETPQLVPSNKFTLEIKLMCLTQRDYYMLYNQFTSDEETCCLYVEGIWFLQAIVMPFFFFEKCDFSYMDRLMRHEFTHQVDTVNNYMKWDLRFWKPKNGEIKFLTPYGQIVQKLAKRKSMYCLNYLYHSMFNLRQEGLADFATRINSQKIEINMTGVRAYNESMRELSTKRLKEEGSDLYEQKIGAGNSTPSGEYTNGRTMCVIIAMWIAKRDQKYYTLIESNGVEHADYQFPDLNKYLNNNTIINIKGLNIPDGRDKYYKDYIKVKSTWILPKTTNEIIPYTGKKFIKFYEGVCDDLGIKEENRIMTVKRFEDLVNKAIQIGKDYKKQRLEGQGFIYKDDHPETIVAEIDKI